MTTTAIAEPIGASEHREPALALAATPAHVGRRARAHRLSAPVFVSMLVAVQVAWMAGLAYAAWLVLV